MDAREAAPGLRCTRVPCEDPETAVFGISGSLGPGAQPLLGRLFDRCMQHQLHRVVLDLSGLESLGGGGARLLHEFAAQRRERGWQTAYIVTSSTLRHFLSRDPRLGLPPMVEDLEAALAAMGGTSQPGNRGKSPAVARAAGQESRPSELGLDQLLDAIGLEQKQKPATAGAVPLESSTSRAPRESQDDPGALEPAAARWRQRLRDLKLAARVHVFGLQPDGSYHPVTTAGIDLERGLPYHGLLATRVREHQGPSFLFDLCIDPLTEEEQDILNSLNCELVAHTGGGEDPELLLFMGKGTSGEEYTLEELQALQQLLEEGASPVPGEPHAAGAVQGPPEVAARGGDEGFVIPWSEQGEIAAAPPASRPERPSQPSASLGSLPSPASLLGEPAYEENARERLLRRKLTQLRDILGLSRDFDATFGAARILEVLVLSVVSVARTETVLLLSESKGEFQLTHHRGLDRSALPEMALRVDSTLVQSAQRSAGPLSIEDSESVSEEEKIWARQHRFSYVMPFRSQERVLGILFLGESQSGDMDLEMLSYLLQEAALAYERALLYETLQDHTLGVVRGLINLVETRSGQDPSSTESVLRYTQALAKEVNFPERLRLDLAYGTVLRDVGMLRIDSRILQTRGQLTAEQWETVRLHPVDGAAIMRQMRFSEAAIEVVMHHHEAYNGEGYPSGLRGREIPLGARLVAVAESYVKMTMDRPYRKALGRVEALESLAENWGLRYDPLIVDALVRVVNRELSHGLEGETEFARDLFGA